MADTWEWGPWAQQGEDYVKSERDKKSKLDVENQTSNNALRNLLVGKATDQTYKIADETRQQEEAVPALRTLISGNKDIGKALGFGQEPQMAVPEAGYAGQSDVRTPTDNELRGLAKGAPGIATTILGKRLESIDKNHPSFHTVPRGATGGSFDPKTNTFTPQVEGKEPGLYESIPEAQAAWSQMSTTNSELAKTYRPTIATDPATGKYRLNLMSNEPLSLQDPYRQEFERNIRANMDPSKATDIYMNRQATAAGARQFQITQNTPMTPDQASAYSKTLQASNAFGQLQSFTEPERRAFIGLYGKNVNEIASAMSGLPGGMAIINALGGNQATIDRYNTFKALLGSIREMAFVTGGKQLTQTEERVVLAKLPTGQEKSYSEFQAKFQYAQKLLKAVSDGMVLANQIPKGDPNYDAQMAQVWRQAFAQNQISTTDPEANVRSQMPSGVRLIEKYGK